MDVVFVVMPFADVERPAIGVSLLKARIAELGCTSRVAYFNLDLAEQMGYDNYTQISDGLATTSMAGEWFFADLVFNDNPPDYEYVNKILSRSAPSEAVNNVLTARRLRSEYIRQCVKAIRADNPRIVAFTTTFHQTCACLAVAKALKSEPDPPITIIGGANCEGEMGQQLLQCVPWLDYVCTGEGDEVFPLFVERVMKGYAAISIPGILRQGTADELSAPEVVRDLDGLPIPDYSDYLSRLQSSPLKDQLKPVLLFETARGCWWGAKQHCTFCGLNGRTMSYRSKSPERAFEELSFLERTYGLKRMSSVDNILDVRYINQLFPKLRDSGLNLELFYEVKANLRFDQLALLRAGGVFAIQPGIESLSNDVLRRMKKGCTGLQNIQLLRWSREVGMTVAWNLLAGFPGESEADYLETAALIPLLTHLAPPTGCSPIRLDRFSPFFMNPQAFGMVRVRPTPAYYYVFPFGRRELARLAYFFDFDYADGRAPINYTQPVRQALAGWWEAQALPAEQQPRLDAEWLAYDDLTISDTRACAKQPHYHFSGAAAQIYAACDSVQSVGSLVRKLDGAVGEASVELMLQQFIDCKLMVEIEDHYVGLAVIKNRSALTSAGGWNDYLFRNPAPPAESLLRVV